jgi:hypothetical protein
MKYQPIRYERERSYPMAVAEAWRLLADTDHLNRAIGLPSVEFSALPDPLIRRAQARAFGVIPVRSLRAAADPAHLFYESQKLRVRAARLLEGLERTSECAAAPGFRSISGGPGTARPRSGSPGAALRLAWLRPPR